MLMRGDVRGTPKTLITVGPTFPIRASVSAKIIPEIFQRSGPIEPAKSAFTCLCVWIAEGESYEIGQVDLPIF